MVSLQFNIWELYHCAHFVLLMALLVLTNCLHSLLCSSTALIVLCTSSIVLCSSNVSPEFADDSWVDGAINHNPFFQGSWTARKSAAIQAYFEYMPIRQFDSVGIRALRPRIFKTLQVGNLLSLTLVDSRMYGREHTDLFAKKRGESSQSNGTNELVILSSRIPTPSNTFPFSAHH